MIIHFKSDVAIGAKEVEELIKRARSYKLSPEINVEHGSQFDALEVYLKDGERACSSVPEHVFAQMPGVDYVVRVTPALVSAALNGVGEHRIAIGHNFVGKCHPTLPVIGPCAVDLFTPATVAALAKCGIRHIRGGCWKPRSRSASFRGMGEAGLEILLQSARDNEIASVWLEMIESHQIDIVRRVRDSVGYEGDIVLWVGARNIGNFLLLEALGCQDEFTVMLKNGLGMTNVRQLFDLAEFVLHGPMFWNQDGTFDKEKSALQGTNKLLFCVRGLMQHDEHDPHRFHPNFGWINEIHDRSWVPVCLDPSHMAGELELVFECLRQGLRHHPDVVLIEAHINPSKALCDKDQAVPVKRVPEILEMINKHNEMGN